jgi:hypothetical protein
MLGGGAAMAGKTKGATPTSAKKFANKARDLDALRDALVDAAGVGAGLWLSYLFLFFYLFIAAAAVTHKDLFFENPVKLPFLNVELPLLGFFWLGPLLFIILHAYVLLHFALLADKIGAFHAELQAQIKDDTTRTRLRRQLPSNIFVQYLAGPNEVRTGVMGFMLRLIALITLVIFPIALLVFFQLQFLPYHSAPITWWQAHRSPARYSVVVAAVAIDRSRAADMDFMARFSPPQDRCAGLGKSRPALAGLHHRDLSRRMAGNQPAITSAGAHQMAFAGIGQDAGQSSKPV